MYTDPYREFNRLEKMIHCFRDWPEHKIKIPMCNNKIVPHIEKHFQMQTYNTTQYIMQEYLIVPGKKSFQTHSRKKC